MTSPGRVYIIGAGPGDPGLITARGLQLLGAADVIVYDRATENLLRWARPDAERIAAGAPAEDETAQDALSMLLADKAREGHTVARLKWGDPFVFDSGAQEALFLHEQGVPFDIVPGVPSAIGASAYAGVPVTYPGAADAVVFLRGHERKSDALPDLDWRALAALDATIVCYAGPRLAGAVLQRLLDHGRAGDEAAAFICRGTQPSQRTTAGTILDFVGMLADQSERGGEAGLLIVGEVASLRDHLRWFDERPLFGRRIIVTRGPDQARDLSERLENLGAEAIVAPTFRHGPAEDPEAVDRAAASVDRYQWVVFESAAAVARFFAALARGPRDLRALGDVSLCAIGSSTADQLVARGFRPDVVVPEFRIESISDAIVAYRPLDGQSVLVVRPDHQRDVLADELTKRGATVTDLVAYRTTADTPDSPAAQSIYRLLLDGQIDAVTFTSPTAVRRFAAVVGEEQAADLLGTTVVAAIGPVTAAAAAELGITAAVVAEPYTVDGLVNGLVRHFTR